MANTATEKELGELHKILAETFSQILKEGTTALTKDGEVVQVTPSPATLNVIRQFLKDSNITAVPNESNSALADLAKTLPTFDSEAEIDEFSIGKLQ